MAEVRSKYREELTGIPPLARDLMLVLSMACGSESEQVLDIDFQYLWMRMQLRILTFLKEISPTRSMTLRGEDFLRDPIEQMQTISSFLGLSWSPGFEDSILHPERSPYASIGPQGAQFGNDVNYLCSPCFLQRQVSVPIFTDLTIPWRTDGALFNEELVRLAHQFGYS